MKKLFNNIKRFPIVFIFFIFLMGFSLLDFIWPKSEFSELENRSLQQMPEFNLKDVLSNSWMQDYEAFVKDQFLGRNTWIDLKSRTEYALLKTENNDILYGEDDYLFAKSFSLDDENRYYNNVEALSIFAQRHPGVMDVMIVPSSAEVLSDKLPFAAPMVSELSYIDEMYAELEDAGANVVNVYDAFIGHTDEYIYYRTDHHWTSLGAFLAYEYYCEQNGLEVFDTNSYTAVQIPDFYGTHYSKSRNYNVVPDEMTYYDLPYNLSVLNTSLNGEENIEDGAIYDYDMFNERDKYAAYLRGNNAYSELEGSGEGKILVVKDSYANSFIPYLTANYEQIGIVDFRMNTMLLDDIMSEYGYDKVLFLYSFDSFTNDSYFAAKMAIASR